MTTAIRIYVGIVAVLAASFAALVYLEQPDLNNAYMQATLSFAGLGVASHILAHKRVVPGAFETISFIPFLTMVVLAPHWSAVLGVALAVGIGELVSDRPPIKNLFNVSQFVFATAVSVLAYRALGGSSLLDGNGFALLALCVALPLFLISNTLAFYGVLSLANQTSFLTLLSQHNPASILYDLLALPFVYVFAWFYMQFGPAGAALLAIPLFGIRELYRANDNLQRTNQELLELMVAAIEARDPYTSGHSRRVAANSRLIAEAIGLKRKQVERIQIAALLHDVGKIYEVFGPILSKPGRLTADELAIMKTHSGLGADLVARVSQLSDVVSPIRHHHENWDGSGYPDGLVGDDIPLGSRVIMFADTIDAMMSDRPYRAALSPLQVRQEIARLAGRQFDPHVASQLLSSPIWARLFENSPYASRKSQGPVLVSPSSVPA